MFLDVLKYHDEFEYVNFSLDLIRESLDIEINEFVKSSNIPIVENALIRTIFEKIKKAFIWLINMIKKIWFTFIDTIKKFINKIKKWFNKLFKNPSNSLPKKVIASFCMESFEPEVKSYNTINDLYKSYIKSIENINKEIDYICNENIQIIKRAQKLQMKVVYESLSDIEPIFERETFLDQKMHLPGTPYDADKRKSYFSSNIQGYTDIDQYIIEGDIFNKEDFEYIKSKQGKMEELYDVLVNTTIDKIIKLLESDPSYLSDIDNLTTDKNQSRVKVTNQALTYFYRYFKTCRNSKEYVSSRMSASLLTYFPKTEEGYRDLQEWIQLKINYNKTLVETLNNMLILNHNMFKLSLNEAQKIALNMNDTWELNEFSIVFKNNIDKFRKENGMIYDFRDINLGLVLNSENIANKSEYGFDTWFNLDKTKRLLKLISKYNVIIQAHEDPLVEKYESLPDIYRSLNNNEKVVFMELYKDEYQLYSELAKTGDLSSITPEQDKEICKIFKHYNHLLLTKSDYEYEQELGTVNNMRYENIYNKYSKKISGLKFRKVIKTFNENKWLRWKTSSYVKVPTGNGSFLEFSDIELLIYQLQQMGFKRIRVVVCNKNHFAVHDKIRYSTKTLVTYGTDILFM